MSLNDELLAEIRAGRRVLVAASSQPQAHRLFADFTDPRRPMDDGIRVVRSSGTDRVDHPSGGWVRFGSGGRMSRGLTVDTLVVGRSTSQQARDELMVCTLGASEPRVVAL